MRKFVLSFILFFTYALTELILLVLLKGFQDKNILLGLTIFFVLVFLIHILYILFDKKRTIMDRKLIFLGKYLDKDILEEEMRRKGKKGFFLDIQMSSGRKKVVLFNLQTFYTEKLNIEERTHFMQDFLKIVQETIKEDFGFIYTVKDNLITCVFDAFCQREDIGLKAMVASLKIHLRFEELKKEKPFLRQNHIGVNMCLRYETVELLLEDPGLFILSGNMSLDQLIQFQDEDFILISSDLYNPYEKRLEVEYLGKYYIHKEELKLYKLICIAGEVSKVSKLNIKKGKESKLRMSARKKINILELWKKKTSFLKKGDKNEGI